MKIDLRNIKEDFSIVTGTYCGKCKTLLGYLKTTNLTFHSISEEIDEEELKQVIAELDIYSVQLLLKRI